MKINWKRVTTLLTACITTLGITPSVAWAYTIPKTVRIGLESVCKGAPSATLGNQEIRIGSDHDGDFIQGGRLVSFTGLTVATSNEQYVSLSEMFETYIDAYNAAKAYCKEGRDAVPAYLGESDWTVYFANGTDSGIKGGTYDAGISANRLLVKSGAEKVAVTGNGVRVQFEGSDNDGMIKLNGKNYRGRLGFVRPSGENMTAVNTVSLEEYLYGVVPSEMPASYETEALKAQAVAARTYAITKLGGHTKQDYQLCDTIHCQVYKGASGEAARTTMAVNETDGVIACYNGQPIEAVFSASSGGCTENSEDVWNAVVPYLKAVPDELEVNSNVWTKTMTLNDLDNLLAAKGERIGKAKDIIISKISDGGRVQELQIIGTTGKKILSKENIRTYFSSLGGSLPSKLFIINGKGGSPITVPDKVVVHVPTEPLQRGESMIESIKSKGITVDGEKDLKSLDGVKLVVLNLENSKKESVSNPVVKPVIIGSDTQASMSTANGKGIFIFEGKGNGHGVGMSQKGAQGMALKGYTYKEILKHYYTGITVE